MPDLTMPLSSNFTLGELLRSDTAERDSRLKEEQYNPPDEVVASLAHLVQTTLQPLRSELGIPIRVNSGYRCTLVNKLVGGSATSQHCLGEAADIELSPTFLTDPATQSTRQRIQEHVADRLGRQLRLDVDQNFYLFAFICQHLDRFDVDQLIHEYGAGFGRPAWVHVAASRRRDGRQILFVGSYTNSRYISLSADEALARGT